MKTVYPVIFTVCEGGVVSYVPDLTINSEGKDMADAIDMARDAIGAAGLSLEDRGLPIPAPSPVASVTAEPGDIVSLVDIDFKEYRRAVSNRAVRRNISLPSWLDVAAQKAGVNVSAITQKALMDALGLHQSQV